MNCQTNGVENNLYVPAEQLTGSGILSNAQLVEKYSSETAIIVNALYEKYQDNPYMLSKTRHLLCNQLTNMLDNILKTHETQQQHFEVMSIEKTAFVESFLNSNQYFYNSSTDSFFFYDGLHYIHIKEDDLLCTILTSISQGRQLMSWKQKTRMNIIKRIKETTILKSVPESETIQFVIELLCPAFFASKNEVKYFLSILGDSIFKKNTHLFHFIKPCAKNFIHYLNELANTYIGTNIYNTFKYKYHEHEYTNCRMVLVNDCIKNDVLWKSILGNYALDILCVASHYSTRYIDSDSFIMNYCNEVVLQDKVFYLHKREYGDMIKQFVFAYLQLPRSTVSGLTDARSRSGSAELAVESIASTIVSESTINMSWKNMQFLWKHYLDSLNLPAIMFQQTLKQLVTEHLKDYYCQDTDMFKGVFSKYLPFIQKFMQFWDETIIEDVLESDFEVEELSLVFKQWSTNRSDSGLSMSDRQILDIVGYYYPTVAIDQDKYLHHIRCTLWDKQMDIQLAIDDMRNILYNQYLVSSTMFTQSSNIDDCYCNTSNTSIYDMYIHYCKYYSGRLIVSKLYFDKYILEHYAEYVVDLTMLSGQWAAIA